MVTFFANSLNSWVDLSASCGVKVCCILNSNLSFAFDGETAVVVVVVVVVVAGFPLNGEEKE